MFLSLSVQVAITKYRGLGDLYTTEMYFSTVVKGWSPRSECQYGWFPFWIFALCILLWWKGWECSLGTPIPHGRLPYLWPYHFPQSPSSNKITWQGVGIKISNVNLEGAHSAHNNLYTFYFIISRFLQGETTKINILNTHVDFSLIISH